MEVIDDLGVIAIFGKVLSISIKLLNFFEKSFFEIVFDGWVDVNVVDSDAGLARIDVLSEQNSHDCALDFSRLIDNDGTFATEFQNAWSKVVSCFLGDQSSCGSWSGETNEVKGNFSDGFSNFDFSLNHSIKPWISKQLLESMYLLNSLRSQFDV